MKELQFQGKPVWVSAHAIKRARERHIIYPDMVFDTIRNGKTKRFGKNLIKFIRPYKNRALVCVGEDTGYSIIIRTVEWGK